MATVFITWFHLNITEQNGPLFIKNINLNSCLQFMETNLNMIMMILTVTIIGM